MGGSIGGDFFLNGFLQQLADVADEELAIFLADVRVGVEDLIAPADAALSVDEHHTEIVFIEVEGIQPLLRRDGTRGLETEVVGDEAREPHLRSGDEPPAAVVSES
jgi:hypothetical protein